MGQHLRRHSQPVICHCDQQLVIANSRRHPDFPFILHHLNTMLDGVLHQGLQNQLQRQAGQNRFLRLDGETELIFEADILNNEVMADMLQLILQRDDVLPLA
ncbi:hypothetical protein D3C75_830020 [compost metagenome]